MIQLVVNSLEDEELKTELLQNIVLSGGGSSIFGFHRKLEQVRILCDCLHIKPIFAFFSVCRPIMCFGRPEISSESYCPGFSFMLTINENYVKHFTKENRIDDCWLGGLAISSLTYFPKMMIK